MKTSTVFAVLLFSILSISCQKNENVETPAAEPVVDIRDSLVEAGWKRGRYVVSYGIDNPVPMGPCILTHFRNGLKMWSAMMGH